MRVHAAIRVPKIVARPMKELLFESCGPANMPSAGFLVPRVCPYRNQSGFLVCWADHDPLTGCHLERYDPPFGGGPSLLGFMLQGTVVTMRVSPSGTYLATGHSLDRYGTHYKAQLWDLRRGELVLEVPHTAEVGWLEFTTDEKFLVSNCANCVVVTSLEKRRRVASYRHDRVRGPGALHPATRLLILGSLGSVWIRDLFSPGKPARLLTFQRKMALSPASQAALRSATRKADTESKIAELSIIESLLRLSETEWVRRLEFSPDGRLLFCASRKRRASVHLERGAFGGPRPAGPFEVRAF